MPFKDTERGREYYKNWRLEHREQLLEYYKKYRLENKERLSYLCKEYYEQHRDEIREHERERRKLPEVRVENRLRINAYRKKIRLQLITILGSRCSVCNNDNIRVLEIDHINGGGRRERIEFGDHRLAYIYYTKNPDIAKSKLQLLCGNCHNIKTFGDE